MIVGVDVSSRRIDLAWVENGRPCRWHQELGGPKTHLIDRLRTIRVQWPSNQPSIAHDGLRANDGYFSTTNPAWAPGHGITDIAIEKPFSQSRRSTAALSAVTGIVTRQAPPWARVAWPSAGELRAAIGAPNNKYDAGQAIGRICWPDIWDDYRPDWDEHELDALTACIGWTRILAAQDAA